MRTHILTKTFIKVTGILIVFMVFKMPCYSIPDQPEGTDVKVTTSIYVGTRGTIFINGDLNCDDVTFTNGGQIFLHSDGLLNVTFPSLVSGDGVFSFLGTGDYNVYGTGNSLIGNLIVNTGGNVFLEDNLNIKTQLNLIDGIVETSIDKVLFVESTDRDAVLFDVTGFNSYVIGYLGRNVLAGNTYYYPVGDNEGAFPLFVENPTISGDLVATYDKGIASDAQMAIIPGITFTSNSGWQIYSENGSGNEFKIGLWAPGLSTSSSEQGILYSQSSDFDDNIKLWNNVNSSQSYLKSSLDAQPGYFTLISRDLKLRNFFLVGNGNTTIFEIPNASNYTNIRLTLYNRLGTRLFYSDSYSNQLDLQDYPTGTYYYELILTEENNEQKIYNFIEVKNEKF